MTTAAAGESENSSKSATEGKPAVRTDTSPTTEPVQNASGDDSPAQTDADAPATTAARPAAQPIIVPAGSMLTVRPAEELGSRISAVGQTFSATLDRDVVVDGQTVMAAGTSATGKVTFARAAGALAGEPNLQLKIISVNVNNADLAVVTSIRNFGPRSKGKTKVRRFIKGLLKSGTIGCELTVRYDVCADLLAMAGGKDREVILDDQSSYSFTLRQSLQIQ
jgi:hypothetical protein